MQPSMLELMYNGNYVCKHTYRLNGRFYQLWTNFVVELLDEELEWIFK